MRRVILESPYRGNGYGELTANKAYARACVRDSLLRGEAPIASHLLYTQPGVLRDEIPEERELGIAAGLAWINVAELMVLYVDRGVSEGMRQAMIFAQRSGLKVECRSLEPIKLGATNHGEETREESDDQDANAPDVDGTS